MNTAKIYMDPRKTVRELRQILILSQDKIFTPEKDLRRHTLHKMHLKNVYRVLDTVAKEISALKKD